jgi:hypothetical protein
MIQEENIQYTIYTGMPHNPSGLYPLNLPYLPSSRDATFEPNFFTRLTYDPHDDETDEDIDLDREESEEEDDNEGDEIHDPSRLNVQKTDLLTKLTNYLANLPTQTYPSSTEILEIPGDLPSKCPEDTIIFVPISPIPTQSRSNQATKKYRKEKRTTNKRTKSSRKARPKYSY